MFNMEMTNFIAILKYLILFLRINLQTWHIKSASASLCFARTRTCLLRLNPMVYDFSHNSHLNGRAEAILLDNNFSSENISLCWCTLYYLMFYRLKDGVGFHMFITTSPCGDARIFSLHESSSATNLESKAKIEEQSEPPKEDEPEQPIEDTTDTKGTDWVYSKNLAWQVLGKLEIGMTSQLPWVFW